MAPVYRVAVGYRTVADVAVVLHFGFLAFLVVGGFAALRWRWVLWLHLAAAAWSLGIVVVGQQCPLTALERWATVRAGGQAPERGFIDRYVEGVVYPGALTGPVRALVALVVITSWMLAWRCQMAAGKRVAHVSPYGRPRPHDPARRGDEAPELVAVTRSDRRCVDAWTDPR